MKIKKNSSRSKRVSVSGSKINNGSSKVINYGARKIPFRIKDKGMALSCTRDGSGVIYKRRSADEEVEKVLLISSDTVLFNPVEPVNKPKHLTPYLLIEFEHEVLIEPKTAKNIVLVFPLEVGVFIKGKKGYRLIDIFTFAKQKFTLYGDTKTGDLCRYWKSGVYSRFPEIDPDVEGIIQLKITNPTNKWITITKAVFNAYGMELFYDSELVSLKARMKLQSELVAETEVLGKPVRAGMKEAIELYTTMKPPVFHREYVMEGGL